MGFMNITCKGECGETKDKKYFAKCKHTSIGYEYCCKDCKKKMITDKNVLETYLKMHNMKLKEDIYNRAVSGIIKDDKNKEISDVFDKVVTRYYKLINLQNIGEETITNNIESKTIDGKIVDLKKGIKTYSSDWKGSYTAEEMGYLEKYYNGLQQDFNIITTNHKDYAKKIAKASLAMDIAYEDLRNGVKNAEKNYDACKKVFDDLSKSAQFAESTRGQNDVVGLGSIGVITKRLEEKGFIPTNMDLDIPPDNIEKVLSDFLYTITNSGGI